ncbi:hypothetical protein NP493_1127g01072 [Ridgeia piscesae]|uniref:Uncharacterized protein n=1 Tax=Ridgeia piscesae TaxID=27915 RepID=A0AAD9KFX7_RIDPI|nr:hypothetical protein NP493_1127g01072 [Ridgeia piscesae]
MQSVASNDALKKRDCGSQTKSKLNKSKTETIIISAPNRKHQQDVSCVSVCGCNIVPSPTIRNLGIMIDCELTISAQVSRMCKPAYYHL